MRIPSTRPQNSIMERAVKEQVWRFIKKLHAITLELSTWLMDFRSRICNTFYSKGIYNFILYKNLICDNKKTAIL